MLHAEPDVIGQTSVVPLDRHLHLNFPVRHQQGFADFSVNAKLFRGHVKEILGGFKGSHVSAQ